MEEILELEQGPIQYKQFTKYYIKYRLETRPMPGEDPVRRIYYKGTLIGFIEYVGNDLYEVWFTDAFKRSL